MPDRLHVFLDSNILFSATYKQNHDFLRFWNTPEIIAMTSPYAVRETRRNCNSEVQLQRLDILIEKTIIVSDAAPDIVPSGIHLPAKDIPILASAIYASADLLITGDKVHFSRWMNQPIKTHHGNLLIIMRPRPFLDWLRDDFGSRQNSTML
ncbi:MAG: PIN domain-containing protein [Silvibacterium sp.]|nr:PIN domain-containing protein [Silvibacterium sp.]MBV8437212.1 PIN domain-containing protein [Silvibacterium sp.]